MKQLIAPNGGRILRLALVTAALLAGASAQAGIVVTSNPADIAAFQSGATIENFDNLSALPIASYPAPGTAGPLVPAGNQQNALTPPGASQPIFFNSGGASFNNPIGNPGVPIGIVAPPAGDSHSSPNVAGPIVHDFMSGNNNLFTDGAQTGFMEVIFSANQEKVGLFVTHGQVLFILKDEDNTNIPGAQQTASAGQFVGITLPSAEARGVTMIFTGPSTIDDFTYAASSSSTGGDGGSTGGGTSVPDTGTAANVLLAGGFLWLVSARRRQGAAAA